MKLARTPEPGRTGFGWVWVGVVVMTAGALALVRLDGGIPDVVVGIALAVCLGVVAMMIWVDRRADRAAKRLVGRR